jgi:predicted dienelactone hydrolase
MTQVEYIDAANGGRPLDYMLIYPAGSNAGATPFRVLFSTNLHLHKDAPVVRDGLKHPLVMFSHGAGGNGAGYAWFGEYLASHGYFVAMLYHYRANTFDSNALYVRSRLWQRPRDISLDITHLLQDKQWGSHIDPNQIGVAGHSQGGFVYRERLVAVLRCTLARSTTEAGLSCPGQPDQPIRPQSSE